MIPYNQLLQSAVHLVGKRASVNGRLIVCGSTSYIAEDYQSFKAGHRSLLDDSGLIAQRIFDVLEPGGGGDCLYDEEAVVDGIVTFADGEVTLSNIESCVVRHGDESIPLVSGK